MDVPSPLAAAALGFFEPFDDSCALQQCPAGLRVLLCEGQQHSADTSALLASCDFSTTVAADAQHALNVLQDPSSHFDVILADASALGHSLSSASARALLDTAASSGTPLVLTADQHTPSQVLEAVHAGAADVLDRPLSHSKLQNLWQHVVRASMISSASDTTKQTIHSAHHAQQQQQHCSTPRQSQMTSQQLAAASHAAPSERPSNPAAGVSSRVLSPMCLGLLDDCSPMEGLQCIDGLGGLALPPLVPSQLDFEPLDSIFTDMQAAEHSAAPSAAAADGLGPVFPSGSPSNSNALTAVAASLFGSSSEQQCSGNTQRVGAAELESSCADATSGSPQSRRRKLRACTSLRSMAAAAARTADQAGDGFGNSTPWPNFGCPSMPPQPFVVGSNMGAAQLPAAGINCTATGSGQWGGASHGHMNMSMKMNMYMPPMNMPMNVPPMSGQLPRGMVWGMPVRSVAVAPGIVPSAQNPAAAAAAQDPAAAAAAAAQDPAAAAAAATATPVGVASISAAAAAHGMQAVTATPAAAAPTAQQACMLPMPVPPMWPCMWGGYGMWPAMCYPMMQQQCYPGFGPAPAAFPAAAGAAAAAAGAAAGGPAVV